MENNRNTGNAGAPPQEMPTWFVRWLNSQQPRNAPNFAAPSTSTAVQRPLAVLQRRDDFARTRPGNSGSSGTSPSCEPFCARAGKFDHISDFGSSDGLTTYANHNRQCDRVLEKICTTTDAAEFLATQEIPGQNPGEKTNIAPRERPRATDHQLRNEPKRPRPNIDRHEVTRPAAPANRGNGFQKRSSDNQQWRNNQPSTSNNRWHNNNGNNSNNHWRKNNPNDNNNNTSSRAQGETS
ncbi:putative uncharacterized protein DDB_G0272516 [Tribolium castaneum]|uniref:putative uncharacterized protein DDB_G0272516 n=1 Tax=Tribolium castaneum TaxID=7070 RepID=UPI0030FEBCCC